MLHVGERERERGEECELRILKATMTREETYFVRAMCAHRLVTVVVAAVADHRLALNLLRRGRVAHRAGTDVGMLTASSLLLLVVGHPFLCPQRR